MTEALLLVVVVLQGVAIWQLVQVRRALSARSQASAPTPTSSSAPPPAPLPAPPPVPVSAPPEPSSLPPEDRARQDLQEAWNDVLRRGARAGLVGLPSASEVLSQLEEAGQGPRWLCVVLGRALRELAVDRDTVERTEVATRRALESASTFVARLEGDWKLVVEPPRGVRTRDHVWLVDESLAQRLRNPVVNGVLQPLVVLRPALFLADVCAVEGEVA